jgi:haloalkane dehalogenase
VLLLHGFPESSYMWRQAMGGVVAAGRRALAPDLLGYGDSATDPPHSWERHVEALEELITELEPGPLVLVVHDWGGLIGLRWACEHRELVRGLLISDSGFFPDGRWHGMASALRTPGEGERLLENLDRERFGQLLGAAGSFSERALDEYWKGLDSPAGRAGALELYRSGDFATLAQYEGCLAELGVPTLIVWGEQDEFSPLAGAHRFKREIPHAELEVIAGGGHFIWAESPERCAQLLGAWLTRGD